MMMFIDKNWRSFCQKIAEQNWRCAPACEINSNETSYIVLKHDVETDVASALRIAQIENQYGLRGSYYVQAYLLKNAKNIEKLRKIQRLGHEVSYHHDVMDVCRGDLNLALVEFESNRKLFEDNGFDVVTVCQHGNPLIERVGYSSNRDFFRSVKTQGLYPNIADIMVNYKSSVPTDYLYFSDAGRQFKLIYDPLNDDLADFSDKNTPYQNLNQLLDSLTSERGNIVSIHPHRWSKSALRHWLRGGMFKVIKTVAKILYKAPLLRKLMNRYYYLAKKI